MKTKCSQRLKRSQLPKIYLTKKSYRIILKLRQWNVLTVEERNLETACIFTTVHGKVWNFHIKIIPELQVMAWELQTLLKTVTIFYTTHSAFNPLPALKLQPLKLRVWLSYGGRWQGKGKSNSVKFSRGQGGKKITSSRRQVMHICSFSSKNLTLQYYLSLGILQIKYRNQVASWAAMRAEYCHCIWIHEQSKAARFKTSKLPELPRVGQTLLLWH